MNRSSQLLLVKRLLRSAQASATRTSSGGSLRFLSAARSSNHQQNKFPQPQNPPAAFDPNRDEVLRQISESQEFCDSMAYSLAFATPEDNIFTPYNMTGEPTELMQQQLLRSQDQLRQANQQSSSRLDTNSQVINVEEPLPKTFDDAVNRQQHRAIVVTEASSPFRVVDVNKEWEGLCGYSYVESKGKTLGELLQGPETNTSAATALVNKLMQGEEAGVVLTNYTKSGRRFVNRVRAGPLIDQESGQVTHFVGVLHEQAQTM